MTSSLLEVQKLLPAMSAGEKALVRKWVDEDLSDALPGIESHPDVCGGDACIVGTRIPVWLLEQARRLGSSEDELLRDYPTLRAEDLVNAWAYTRSHIAEIDATIVEQESA